MQKGFAPILILLGILLVVVVAGGVFYFGRQTNPKPPQNQVIVSNPQVLLTTDKISNWKTYTNQKYGYEIKFPTNWFEGPGRGDQSSYQPSDFESQSFTPSTATGGCGGAQSGVFVNVLDNPNHLSANDFLKNEITSGYGNLQQIKFVNDRMGFEANLDVSIAEGFPGAGSPGPTADINLGNKIVEISTEPIPSGYDNTAFATSFSQIFSTFKLITADPNIQEIKVDTNKKFGSGDIEVITGSDKKIVTNWSYNYNPLLSPNKTKIVYLSESKESVAKRNGDKGAASTSNNIWIINIDGSNPIQITKHFDNIFRRNLHWLDNDRVVFTDGLISVKVYSTKNNTTQTILGQDQPIPNPSSSNSAPFVYNSDYSYLVRLGDNNNQYQTAVANLTTLKSQNASQSIPSSCYVGFGLDNKTFISIIDNNKEAIFDLTSGQVSQNQLKQ